MITVQCNVTLTAMDDVVESPDPASTSSMSPLECTYSITVYAGYGVEIQVKCFSLGTAGIIINCKYFSETPFLTHHTGSHHINYDVDW